MADSGGDAEPTGIAAWFPSGRLDLPGWRFDVITLLAVIGESSVAVHAQTLTASKMCLLPRIIPAPQALLRPTRPTRLPEVNAKLAGVYGGTVLDTVGFFANIMHPLEELKPYAFKALEIKHRPQPGEASRRPAPPQTTPTTATATSSLAMPSLGALWRRNRPGALPVVDGERQAPGGLESIPETRAVGETPADLEMQPISSCETPGVQQQQQQQPGALPLRVSIPRRAMTAMSEKVGTMVYSKERYAVLPRTSSPLERVSLLSFLLTVGIFIVSAIFKDGTAMVAIFLMGLASSVTCYASWWRPLLMHRPADNKVPPGDVMIRTRDGAFLLIRCKEEVSRELYTATEECQYVSTTFHRVFMGIGMVLLMVAVVLLGNCGWSSQAMVGTSYILLNAVYWVMGLVPPKYFWDLSRYEVEDITKEDAKNAHLKTSDDPHEGAPSFTRTLWYAIRETRHGAWVERSGAMPSTEQWKKWLAEASDAAWKKDRGWAAVTRKSAIMKEDTFVAETPTSPTTSGPGSPQPIEQRMPDPAEQAAPLQQVQPQPFIQRTATGL